MTTLSFLLGRVARWWRILDLYAYELARSSEVHANESLLRLHAARPALLGGPRTRIDVREIWRPGRDPQALTPTVEGNHLQRASWHAQIGGRDTTNAERLDIDRTKPAELMRHRHPYGSSNDVRQATTISTPEAWLLQIETTVALHYDTQDEQE